MKKYEIWYADLPRFPGSHVQTGRRPVLIVSSNAERDEEWLVTVVPLTTKYKRLDLSTHVLLKRHGMRRASMAKCEQILTLDRSRLIDCVGYVSDPAERSKLCRGLAVQLGIAA